MTYLEQADWQTLRHPRYALCDEPTRLRAYNRLGHTASFAFVLDFIY